MKLLDTFAGIGGFSYAAEKLVGGFETTQFIEINPYCQKVLNKNWSHVPIHDDITTFTAKSGEFDIITGGFPCQDISVAGLQKGITKETRSGLFYELIRVIRMVRPRYVVLENVAAILNRGLDIVLRELYEAGYDAEWAVISASSLGAAHRRSRWWLVAYTNSIGCGGGSGERRSIQERSFLSGEQERREMGSETEGCSNTTSNSNDDGSFTSTRIRINGETNSDRQEGEKKISKSQKSSKPRDSGIIQQTPKWRDTKCKLNPNWERYASEPRLLRGDDGLSNRVDRLKALGNSVVPQVAAIPLQRVKDLYATAS